MHHKLDVTGNDIITFSKFIVSRLKKFQAFLVGGGGGGGGGLKTFENIVFRIG